MPDGHRLILVVGPSGAGKDSIISGARTTLASRADVVFPRRVITRAADATGAEDHEPCDPDTFRRRAEAGEFALHWQANGLRYGVPAIIDQHLAAECVVVVNVSRAIVAAAQARYPGLGVCLVTASAAVRAARLRQRGREPLAGIAARLSRAEALPVFSKDVVTIDNDGLLSDSVAALVDMILQRLDGRRAPGSGVRRLSENA